MASRRLTDLGSEMQERVKVLRQYFDESPVNILIYCTARSLEDQAKLYRQSRTKAQIHSKATTLTKRGFDFLAAILWSVGPQKGKLGSHVTNAGPGESYHQYGRAIDAVPEIGGKLIWDSRHGAWDVYCKGCIEAGLEWAGTWRRFKEFPHAQCPGMASNPLDHFTPLSVLSLTGGYTMLREARKSRNVREEHDERQGNQCQPK